MKRIELYTSSLEYVTTVIVPPFQDMPKVIIWGTRIFVFNDVQFKYCEAFAYCAFTNEEMKNMGITPA